MTWDSRVFEELYLESSRNGIYKKADFHGHGTKIVNMGELFAYGKVGEQPMQYVEITEKEAESFLLHENDLLFARRSLVESGAGKVSIVHNLVEDTTFESSIIRVRLDPKKCSPLFYYYWFMSPRGRAAILPLVTGINVKGIRGTELCNIEVDYPPICVQERIASTLSAYDDLIENNQKQIKLLEEAGQRLYKEWFVDLRFPGHEDTPIVDGVPEGWKRVSVTDLLTVKYGKDHKALKDGGTPVFGSGGIVRKVEPVLYSGESVLIPRKGSLNNIMYVTGDFWTIDTMFYTIPKCDNIVKLCYLYLSELDMYAYNIGAAVPSMTVQILNGIYLLLPDDCVRSHFEKMVSPLFELIRTLQVQNQQAEHARNTALSLLMES